MAAKKKTKKEKEEKVAKVKDSDVKLVQTYLDKFLSLLTIEAETKVTKDKENEAVRVDIDTKESAGLLIGSKGENVNALQSILSMMVRQKKGDWVRVLVNIGDWRERQEDYLKDLAQQVSQRVKDTGEAQPLYNLTPSQRRVIHLELAEDKEVETESLGEDEERYLLVKPAKTSKK